MPGENPVSIYRIRVALRSVTPPVWRRIDVPAGITLDRLHDVLQVAMGWSDSHLHCFRVGRTTYGLPDPDYPHDVADERGVRLDQVAATGDTLVYEYDFGDGWEHSLEVEKVVAAERDARYPRCTDGRRAVPPEDCGGPGGYRHLLEVLADPDHEEHADMLEWLGGPFDPEAFDPDYINAELEVLDDAGAVDDEDWLDEVDAEPSGPEPEFTAAQAAELAAFLAAPARPEGTFRYEELAGFLFAIACSPELIPPSEWLPLAFNGQDGGFAGIEEAQRVLAAIMALYNQTVYGVDEERLALPPGIDLRAPATANFADDAPFALWARGFIDGYTYLEELWDAYVPESLDEEIGSCAMVLSFFSGRELAEGYRSEMKDKGSSLEEVAETIARLVPDAMQSFAQIAWSIQTVLREQATRPIPVRSEKTGRNEPCPCGSGKKYKKCCGANLR